MGIGVENGAYANVIAGNYLGTDITGTSIPGPQMFGIQVRSPNNRIGGLEPGEGNLASGNQYDGISLLGAGAVGNVIAGNTVGLDAPGRAVLTNGHKGISLEGGTSGTRVERNVVANSGISSAIMVSDWGTSFNVLVGNHVNTDSEGRRGLGNSNGVSLNGTSYNSLGGANPGDGNVIAGGVAMSGGGATGNLIRGNSLGTDESGGPLPVQGRGVWAFAGVRRLIIGGATAGEGNRISNHSQEGIRLDAGVDGVWIAGNRITDNGSHGIDLYHVEGTVVLQNAISANSGNAVTVRESPRNTLRRNSIFNHRQPGIMLVNGGNQALGAPVITSAGGSGVTGTACRSCTVEIFSDDLDEGRLYEGTVLADEKGTFVFVGSRPSNGPNLTATATDAGGNTSPFSAPFLLVRAPPPTGILRP